MKPRWRYQFYLDRLGRFDPWRLLVVDVLNELRRPDDAYLARPTRLGMAGRANRTLTQLRR